MVKLFRTKPSSGRFAILDVARGAALVAMIVYHFSWDLRLFGFLTTEVLESLPWRLFARTIAASFLFIVGIGLVLAHGEALRWRPFLSRLGRIAGAAGLVTLGTYLAFPQSFIFFGILHQIAVASVLGLAFLRLPPPVTALAGGLCLALPLFASNPVFNAPGWLWLGLSTRVPATNDYVPLLPWFGFVLAGMAAGPRLFALARERGWLDWRPKWLIGRTLAFGGRHSLIVYLVHQPILLGAVWLAAQVANPNDDTRTATFMSDCQAACIRAGAEAGSCVAYCSCAAQELKANALWSKVFTGALSEEERLRVAELTRRCRPEDQPLQTPRPSP